MYKYKTLVFNFSDLESCKKAEKAKMRLENQGAELVFESPTKLTYKIYIER